MRQVQLDSPYLGASPRPQASAPYIQHYRDQGYAVIKGLFDPEEMYELAAAFDRIQGLALSHPKSFRHQNVFLRSVDDTHLGRIVRFAQWPSYIDEVLNRFRLDPRLLEVLEPLIGRDIKQIINQLNWKPPGAAMADFCFHQDIHFRRPSTAYRNPFSAYVQTALAVEPHRRENGALRVYPGSHKLGPLEFPIPGRVMERRLREEDIEAVGLDPAELVDLELDPGDLAMWSLYMIHGSGPNDSPDDRRVYLNGYVRAADCDRGEWAFRDGLPCPLGEPVLVHYEDLYNRPEPHYLDD